MQFPMIPLSIALLLTLSSTTSSQQLQEESPWQLIALNYSTTSNEFTIVPPSGQLNFELQRANHISTDICKKSWQWDASNLYPLGWNRCNDDLWFRLVSLIEANRTLEIELLEGSSRKVIGAQGVLER
jgi:hypothetical protein